MRSSREKPGQPLITYHLAIDEHNRVPVVVEEWLQWRRGQRGKPFRFLQYDRGQGRAVSGDLPDERDKRIEIPLNAPDLLAVNALGQFADHPRVAALRSSLLAGMCPIFQQTAHAASPKLVRRSS